MDLSPHLFGVFLVLIGGAHAWRGSTYTCESFMVEVPVTDVPTVVLPIKPLADGYEATSLANMLTQRVQATPLFDFVNLTATFNISAEYCEPTPKTKKSSTLQILSHGLGFDRSYWDFHLPSDPGSTSYSYVHAALAAGYSTLAYNRLGIEPSTIADPYTAIQAPVEVEVLNSLTLLVRQGQVAQVPTPAKVIHVGHSWGSFISAGIAATQPALTDGIVLTGESMLAQYQPLFIASTTFHLASTNQPDRFPADVYSNGFLTWPDKFANQYSFFAYPFFDTAVLEYAEAHKYPFTVGEFLTGSLFPLAAPAFKGPVLYLAADRDLIFCASNCTGLYGPDSAAVRAFNASKRVEVHIQPDTGHSLNLHFNASGSYSVIMDWASRHGL